ncbi:MAG: 50S ribosomal protein L10 [Chloroflexi bacterium]|nr:50S ribosomal protein L10 [Chloroflexota bacterium]
MPTEKKLQAVAALEARLRRCTIGIATSFQGLSSEAMTSLRRRLREKGIELHVVKNTLTYIAAEKAQRPQFRQVVQGPTALVLGYGDPTEPARALDELIRSLRLPLAVRGAVTDGRVLTPQEVAVLATLPNRQEMAARLVGQLKGPFYNLLYLLNQPLQGLALVLARRVETISAQE